MDRSQWARLIFLLLGLVATIGARTHSHGGTQHVRGYTRKNGTYVHGYERRKPSTTTRSPRVSRRAAHLDGKYCSSCRRDNRGREVRSAAAKHGFEALYPCPATGRSDGACPGYVVDHISPLACGGPDAPSNMQWQTVAGAKEKDRVERKGCL